MGERDVEIWKSTENQHHEELKMERISSSETNTFVGLELKRKWEMKGMYDMGAGDAGDGCGRWIMYEMGVYLMEILLGWNLGVCCLDLIDANWNKMSLII